MATKKKYDGSKIDLTSMGEYIISDLHYRIHEGITFDVCHIFPAVVDDANADILMKVGDNNSLHTIVTLSVGGDAYLYIYESPTTSANGTALTAVNRNRFSTNTTDSTFFYTPTVTNVGTQLSCELIPGGTKNQAGGGAGGISQEFIFKTGLDYLIRVTNKAGAAKDISITPLWYEP